MSSRPACGKARFAALALCATVVATVASASPAVAARDPWRALLARVPASGSFPNAVIVNDYEAARAAADTPRTGDRVKDLFELEQATGIAPTELLRAEGPGDPLADELGIRSRDVARDLTAGDPPDELTLLEGRIDPTRVQRAVESDDAFSDRLETVRHGGERYYAWGERVDPGRRSPLRPLGIGGHLLVDPPYAAWSDRAATVEAAIDAAAGDVDSLADDRDLVAATRALTRRGGYAGFLATEPVAPGIPTGGPPALAPYEAVAIGPSLDDHGAPEVVVVLAYADAATARAQADGLRTLARDGTSVTGAPWSEIVTIGDVAPDGRLVVGRFTTTRPRLWLDVVLRRDSLLASV